MVFGGFITLAGTAVVQVIVIPQVQARTRRRERWENDVMELAALVDEELPPAIRGYHSADVVARVFRRLYRPDRREEDLVEAPLAHQPGRETVAGGGDDGLAERVEEQLRDAESELREADQALGHQMARLQIRIARVERINRNWRPLSASYGKLRISLWKVEDWEHMKHVLSDDEWGQAWGTPLSNDEWEQAWNHVRDAHKKLSERVDEFADTLKPPRLPRMWRLRQWAGRRIRAAKPRDRMTGP